MVLFITIVQFCYPPCSSRCGIFKIYCLGSSLFVSHNLRPGIFPNSIVNVILTLQHQEWLVTIPDSSVEHIVALQLKQ